MCWKAASHAFGGVLDAPLPSEAFYPVWMQRAFHLHGSILAHPLH